MEEAELALIGAALTSGQSFRYLKLLSGDSYPLCSACDLVTFFDRQTHDFYSFWRLTDRTSWGHKVRFRYFHNLFWLNSRHATWSHLLLRLYPRTVRYGLRLAPPPTGSAGVPRVFYGGAQWWTLRAESAQYVASTLTTCPDLVRFFRQTDSPDELVFQTLLQNSPFAKNATRKARYEAWSRDTPAADKHTDHILPEEPFHLTYLDWSPARELPAILTDADFDGLRYTDCLFARKFDAVWSATLLDQLDVWLGNHSRK